MCFDLVFEVGCDLLYVCLYFGGEFLVCLFGFLGIFGVVFRDVSPCVLFVVGCLCGPVGAEEDCAPV